ncbi:uncharacterized protein LOC124172689 isoform X2 [Ischnura elegans]|uniref:uncharacterized protein LOC124172689 isoform X2 n=1 Tax=Ischnura elegans TaxID=197161 RepID=UPI001ED8B779|nr:uncharacterized protein LOC124172689 isoform X2 [Ischnura elegans]
MNHVIDHTMCRLCLCKGRLFNIFEDHVEVKFTVKAVIEELLQLKVEKEVLYPWMVCRNCLNKLFDFIMFKRRCMESQLVYDNRIRKKKFSKGKSRKSGTKLVSAMEVDGSTQEQVSEDKENNSSPLEAVGHIKVENDSLTSEPEIASASVPLASITNVPRSISSQAPLRTDQRSPSVEGDSATSQAAMQDPLDHSVSEGGVSYSSLAAMTESEDQGAREGILLYELLTSPRQKLQGGILQSCDSESGFLSSRWKTIKSEPDRPSRTQSSDSEELDVGSPKIRISEISIGGGGLSCGGGECEWEANTLSNEASPSELEGQEERSDGCGNGEGVNSVGNEEGDSKDKVAEWINMDRFALEKIADCDNCISVISSDDELYEDFILEDSEGSGNETDVLRGDLDGAGRNVSSILCTESLEGFVSSEESILREGSCEAYSSKGVEGIDSSHRGTHGCICFNTGRNGLQVEDSVMENNNDNANRICASSSRSLSGACGSLAEAAGQYTDTDENCSRMANPLDENNEDSGSLINATLLSASLISASLRSRFSQHCIRRTFNCRECSKTFASQSALVIHQEKECFHRKISETFLMILSPNTNESGSNSLDGRETKPLGHDSLVMGPGSQAVVPAELGTIRVLGGEADNRNVNGVSSGNCDSTTDILSAPKLRIVLFKCKDCGETFRGKDLFLEHKKKHVRAKKRKRKRNRPERNASNGFNGNVRDPDMVLGFDAGNDDDIIFVSASAGISYDSPLFWCEMCGSQFKTKSTLDFHCQSRCMGRDANLAHKCDTCDKRFSLRSTLELHMKYVHVQNQKRKICPTCGESFKRMRSLRRHDVTVHMDNELLERSCTVCWMTFNSRCSLRSHKLKVHPKRKNTNSSKRKCVGIRENKPYFCGLCSKTFFLESSLKDHLEKHKRSGSHHCLACGEKFTRLAALRLHQSFHSELFCKICNRFFGGKASLDRHMLSHVRQNK